MEPSDALIETHVFFGLVVTAFAPVVKGLINILIGATTRSLIVKSELRSDCALTVLRRVVVKYLLLLASLVRLELGR